MTRFAAVAEQEFASAFVTMTNDELFELMLTSKPTAMRIGRRTRFSQRSC
ncbi:hypothetical protein Rleg9DRAFT_0660 [Rhizobium leguminosarum bv. trifolii WSM597]|uniref:Uncharacterized protein n=1 Tax=Rhizobium leguminosarum bv. trifolii WSM597 TaxID=754764 RepID=I9N204_RHILT|nr:hypothetical protein Rleg9DRAFT_0660 [Rhizobium leguminosarum bv. trifolii WSM597]